jgi:hypothetical protein
MVLRDWTEGGGRLIVVSTGGIRATDGKWGALANVLPVSCGAGGDCRGVIETVYAPKIYIEEGQFEHPLAKNIDPASPLTNGTDPINLAHVTVNTKHILYVGGFKTAGAVVAGQTGDIYPAFSENAGLTGGKVLYISFNPVAENLEPQIQKSLVINSLAYILGAAGYK